MSENSVLLYWLTVYSWLVGTGWASKGVTP